MKRRQWQQMDDGNLQADVMRFLAIVALCLVAILAMVRNVSPDSARPDQNPPTTSEVQEETTARSAPPSPVLDTQPSIEVAIEVITPEAAPQNEQHISLHETQIQTQEVQSDKSTVEDDQSLSLKFSSDSDFLRLVATGKVTVYAFSPDTFLSMNRDYKYSKIPPPLKMYELDASTVPNLLKTGLPPAPDNRSLSWAVDLPPNIERQVREFIDKASSGELLINRYEEVRHVQNR